MHKYIVIIICSVSILVLFSACLIVPPCWSALGDKKTVTQRPNNKDTKEPGDLKDGMKSDKSIKKKVVKKAGAVALTGVTAEKVASGMKNKITTDKE